MDWTGEAEPGFPYWWEGADWKALDAAAPDRVDLLIIGAGYTGLSAAIAAHDAGAKVAVVDAAVPGQGASTRNGGMTGAHPRLGWEALRARFGESIADGLFAEARPALNFVKDLIAREKIDCDLQETGRIQLAWTPSHFASQKNLARRVREKSGVAVDVVERDALSAEISTERYFGGIVFPEHCAVHPRKYHAGLLEAVLRRGISVAQNCAVTGLAREASGFSVQTLGGAVLAEKVLLATNGYTPPIFRWYQRRVFPVPSYLIATEELPANLIEKLAPGKRMMVETRARHSYFRVSPDGKRILFGGRAAIKPVDLATAAQRLKATMTEVWPELTGVRLSHIWTGNTGYTFNHIAAVGQDRGLHHAMGFSGSGTVMAPYLGAKAAWQALGDARGETAYALTGLRSHWAHPFRQPHFLSLADLWYRFAVDPKETRAGR